MGWADFAIKELQQGNEVTIKPRGNSMSGKIESGEEVTIEPVAIDTIEVGDIVLCKVKGKQYLHLVKGIKNDSKQFLIGNNKGRLNGWTSYTNIYGRIKI